MMRVVPSSGAGAPFRINRESSKPDGQIPSGALVQVLTEKGKWAQVQWEYKHIWLKKANLALEPTAAPALAIATDSIFPLPTTAAEIGLIDPPSETLPTTASAATAPLVEEAASSDHSQSVSPPTSAGATAASATPIDVDAIARPTGSIPKMMRVASCHDGPVLYRQNHDVPSSDGFVPVGALVRVLQYKGKWAQVEWGSESVWVKKVNLEDTVSEDCASGRRSDGHAHSEPAEERDAKKQRVEGHRQDHGEGINAMTRSSVYAADDEDATSADECTDGPSSKKLRQALAKLFKTWDVHAMTLGSARRALEEFLSLPTTSLDSRSDEIKDMLQVLVREKLASEEDQSSATAHVMSSQLEHMPSGRLRLLDLAASSAVDCDDIGKAPEWVQSLHDFLRSKIIDEPDLTRLKGLGEVWPRLYAYQREGVLAAASRSGRILIADEMGLGKTVQALALLAQYAEDLPALIVVPTFLCGQWKAMAKEWLNFAEDEIQILRNSNSSILHTKRIVIMSYDMIRMVEHFRRQPTGEHWPFLICDESHRLKNRESDRFKAVFRVAQDAQRVILLSGTPTPNSFAELWAQLALLLPPDVCPTFENFANRYSVRIESKRLGVRWKGYRGRDELQACVMQYVMKRREKVAVMSQLPSLRRHRVTLTLSDESGMVFPAATAGDLSDKAMWASRACDAKLDATVDYVKEAILPCAGPQKFVFFAHHHKMMDAMQEAIKDADLQSVCIDGRVPRQEREALIARFQQDTEVKVALCSIMACGEGVSLTAATHIVFCELHWTPATLEQCEARVHRPGQTEAIDVRYIVAEGTIDEHMWRILTQKSGI